MRVTHDFLKESDIQELKPLILEHYFDAVDLRRIDRLPSVVVSASLAEDYDLGAR